MRPLIAIWISGQGQISKFMLGHLLCPTLSIPWTMMHQASLSMGFPKQEYWSGFSFPPPGDIPDPGTKPTSPVSPALQGNSLSAEPSRKPIHKINKLTYWM